MALRFPSDIGSSSKSKIHLKIHQFDGFNLAKIHEPSQFDVKTSPKEQIVLPIPDSFSQQYSANFSSINSLSADLREKFSSMFNWIGRVEASAGASMFAPSANIYQGNESQRHSLTWTLVPNTSQEAETIEDIAKALSMASLPDVQNAVIALMPDMLEIKIKNHGFISFMLSFIEGVSLNATPTGMFQQYRDGKLPVYELGLNLIEVTQRTKQIEQHLRES